MMWIAVGVALIAYATIVAFLCSITSARNIRVGITIIALCLPAWNVLPVWAIYAYQCETNAGVKIHKPFDSDAIILHDSYSLAPLSKQAGDGNNIVYCDSKCESRLLRFFSSGIGEIAVRNNVAIEISNLNIKNSKSDDPIYNRFWLTDTNDEYCVAHFIENLDKKDPEKQSFFKDKCVAVKSIDAFSTNYEYIEKPFKNCPVKKDRHGEYVDHKRCRFSEQDKIISSVTRYSARIVQDEKTVAEASTFKGKATTFSYVPVKLQQCGTQESNRDYKKALFQLYLANNNENRKDYNK